MKKGWSPCWLVGVAIAWSFAACSGDADIGLFPQGSPDDTASAPSSRSGSGGAGGATVSEARGGALPLAERIEQREIQLAAPVGFDFFSATVAFPAARPGGGMVVGWNSGSEGHITRLDANLKVEGADWIFEEQVLVSLTSLTDGGFALFTTDYTRSLTSSDEELILHLIKLNAQGQQEFSAQIVGGDGQAEGAKWFRWTFRRAAALVEVAGKYLVFAKINENHSSLGATPAAFSVEVGTDGAVDRSTEKVLLRGNSELLQALVGTSEEPLTLSVGTGPSYGVMYANHAEEMRQIVWPPEDQQDFGSSVSVIDPGEPCGFQRIGEQLFATVATGRTQPYAYSEDAGDALLLSWPIAGGAPAVSWLTDTPDVAEICPSLSTYGDAQLVIWGERDVDDQATLAVIDTAGALIDGPTAIDAPFNRFAQPISLADGSVAWVSAEPQDSSAQLVVVRPP